MNRLLFVFLGFVLIQLPRLHGASAVVISEIMADNTRTLQDEDGDSEDWIEIRNVSNNPVNLLNWALTDDAGDLTKWRFPATNLNVGAYMVIFASDKDRRVPGRPLHTNFRLSPSGDYLALIEPNGTNLATVFSPRYPAQVPNVSYGFGVVSSNTTLIGPGAAVRVLVPTEANGGSALGDTWRGANEPFADGGWRTGVTGVGFSAAGAPSLVAASAMTVRFNFDAAPVGTTILDTKPVGTPNNGVNAGAVWTASSTDNSPTPIARSGAMAFSTLNTSQITLAGNAIFNTQRGTISFWMRSQGFFGIGQGPAVLLDRQVISGNLNSGAVLTQTEDGRLQMQAYTNGLLANWVVSASAPSDDRWHHIAVVYDQTAAGSIMIFIDGRLDNSANNSRGWAWPAVAQFELGRSHLPSYRMYNGLLDDFRIYNRPLSNAEIAEVHAGDGGVPSADLGTDVGLEMQNVNSSAFLRLTFNIADSNAFSLLTLRVRHNDGFAAWINGRPVAAVNAPDPLSWDSAATAPHSSSLAESVTIGNVQGLLRAGANVLAVQGLNVSALDPTFLVLPELVGASAPIESATGLYFTQPTPGAANTGGTTNTGPLLTEVGHVPNVPVDSEDLRVSARVQATFGAISNVTLRYRIMHGGEVSVPMNDGGVNGDLVAGDGLWSGLIPASASTNGQMIRYYVSALDIQNNSSKWPLFYNPTNSEQYLGTIVDPTNVVSKLPIFHIFFPPAQSNTAGTENGTRCAFFYDGEFYDNVRIELRGNTSAGFDKKAYRLEFNRDHRLRHPGPGERISDTSLLGEWADPAYFRQAYSFWLLDAFGTPSPFDYPVRVQLNADFFMLAMHNDVMGREQLERMGYNPSGALYKAAGQVVPSEASTGVFEKRTRLFEDHSDYLALANAISDSQNAAVRTTNVFDMLDVPQVINYLVCARWTQEADDVWANMTLYRDTEGDQLWRIIPFDMNVSWGQLYCGDSAGNFNVILATNDNYKSHPLYGGSSVLPTAGGANWNRMYDVIVRTPATREMLLRRMRSLLDTVLQPPDTHPLAFNLEQKIRDFTNSIWEEAFMDRRKWLWPAASGARGPYCWGYNQWLTNHVPDTVNQFVGPRRRHWYTTHCITNTARAIGISNLSNAGIPLSQPANAAISVAGIEYNPASANQAEEYLCLTNPNPYAVDISGWKLGGAVDFTFKSGTVLGSNRVLYVSPNTLAFRNRSVAPKGGMALFVTGPYRGQLSARGEPVTITDAGGRLVYTNVYSGGPSSAQQFLRVTELMYNPSGLPANPTDPQDFEYLELRNISTDTTVDLTGVRFSNGVLFDFTGSAVTTLEPGQRVLVVKNQTAFTARYGAANIAGQYLGNLDNAGERVQLIDASNEEILDFTYNNSWYPITDGAGYSLVISNEFAEPDAWGRREGWRPNGQLNGAPGQSDPPFPVFAGIVVSEVLADTDLPQLDAIELHNPTASPVNLSGWFLSDDFDNPKKYRLTNGCIIAAGGYLSIDASLFNNPATAPVPFALSSKGETVWLFSADPNNNNLTGYVFGEDFGASAKGVSLGRHTNSVGQVHFVAQVATTLGAANSAPRVGPVVISEIMYHPPDRPDGTDDSEAEYVELQNISATPVAFYDPNFALNTWRLRGGVDYEFPTGLLVPPDGTVLLVSFDTNEVRKLAAFRTRYSVPAAVPIYGPYRGKLDNSSDNVRLERPGSPEAGDVPYILVDRVEYRDDEGWPTAADGTGAALQRVAASAYGNDPASWTAVTPRPGAVIGGGTPPTITVQPADRTGLASQSASMSVTATGSLPLHYQWQFNGENIESATGSTLILQDLRADQAGFYSVTVYNAAGAVTSSNATLSVALPAYITSHPRGVTLRGSTNNSDYGFTTNNAAFNVAAVSSTPITYQWRFIPDPDEPGSAVIIPGANGDSLVVNNVGLPQEGLYDVLVTDNTGSVPSAQARLKVLVNPTYVQVPANQTVVSNGSFSSSVVIRGNPPPFRYEWREISTVRGSAVTAEVTNFFTSGPVTNFASRAWRLVVFNEANTNGILSQFSVQALPDSDGDGLPDVFETDHGLDPGNNADRNLDADSDGLSNWAEYTAGTDPTNRLSYLKVDNISVTGGASVTFQALANKTYSVQYTDDLNSGAWFKLGDVIAQTASGPITLRDPAATTNRFYRLITPQK